jgi:hypothetical protein
VSCIFCIVCAIVFNYTMGSSKSSNSGGGGGGGSSNSGFGSKIEIPTPGSAKYIMWCSNMSNNSIYDMGSKLNCDDNYQVFCIGLMAAVFFTLCIEIAVHSLEHHITNFVTLEILNKMYRELMTMGFISFSINMLESLSLFELVFAVFNYYSFVESLQNVTNARMKIFELVHICLFVLSIVYVIAVSLCYFLCRMTWRRWSSFELLERSERGAILRRYKELKKRFNNYNRFLRFLNFKLVYDYLSAIEMYSYYNIKKRFLLIHKLPSSFRFDIYLKARIRKLFLYLIEIRIEVWLFVFILMLLNYARVFAVSSNPGSPLLYCLLFFGLIGLLPLLLCLLLYSACRIGYSLYQRRNTLRNSLKGIPSDLEANLLQEDNSNSNIPAPPSPPPTLEELSNIEYEVDMTKYFLFQKPRTVFYAMQFVLLCNSFYITMLAIYFRYVCFYEVNLPKFANVLIYIMLYTPSIVMLLFIFPWMIAPYTILTSVDNYTSHKTINYTFKRTEALQIRARVNMIISKQPNYHPLRKQLKKTLMDYYPVLSESGDFHTEKYFVQNSRRKREQQKQLQNLIIHWYKRMSLIEKAKENNLQDVIKVNVAQERPFVHPMEQKVETNEQHAEADLDTKSEFYDDDEDI